MHTLGRYATCLVVLLANATICAAVDLNRQMEFAIPAQKLDAALMEFSRQAKVQLIASTEQLRNLETAGVTGSLTISDALKRLLGDSGLAFQTAGESAISIGRSGMARSREPIAGASTAFSSNDANELIHVAEVDGQAEESHEGQRGTTPERAEDSRSESLQEIVVTAQKRTERLQEVPISISVLGGEQLDSTTAQGMLEVLNRTPGVAMYGSDRPLLSVRGVSAGSVTASAGSNPVSFYLDTVPFGLARQAIVPDVQTYDLERVEVLRGPQGTLYGANAQTGVIRVLTKDANPDEFELKARTAFSNTKDGGNNFRGDAAINLPVIEDKLAVRGAFTYQDLDGWIDRSFEEDANDAEIRMARFKVGAWPTEQLSINLLAWLSRADYGAPANADINRQHVSPIEEPGSSDYDVYGLKIGYDAPAFSVNGMTGYLDYEHVDIRDVWQGLFNGLVPVRRLSNVLDAQTFSQELILTAIPGSAWQWTLGGMYRDTEDRLRQNSLAGGIPFDYSQGSQSYAVFGEIGRRFVDEKLGLTLGLRYFHDDAFIKENISQGPPGSSPIYADASFTSTTPRVVLTWYPSKQMTFYGSYAQGFRSGFPQSPSVARAFPTLPALEPDKLHNYELGLKAGLLGGRLSLETAAFFIDWEDTQQSLSVPVGGTFVAAQVNSKSASGLGFEFAATARPTDRLELTGSFGWNDLALDADVTTGALNLVLFAEDARLNGSPEYTAGLSADYRFPLGAGGLQGRLSGSANYLSELIDRFLFVSVRTSESDSIVVSRASFAVESSNRWTATLFIDNINDEDGATAISVISPDLNPRIRPRTVGLQLEFSF